jgi:ribonuclease HI
VFVNPEGQVLEYRAHFEFSTTNNVAEYKAFLAGLRLTGALNDYPL